MMRDERTEDKPPYSRVFVVCNKQLRSDDLRSIFEKYGEIEDLHLPRDRITGESKGIAYIKFNKTSSAAAAIDALHMKHMQNCNKPLKVMVATTKNEEKNDNENKYKRLFVRISKDSTEDDIKDHFSKFGHVEQVYVQKNRETQESRGFAYVNYNNFHDAAVAFEQCDKKYKPVFATPREELKRSRTYMDSFDRFPSSDSVYIREQRNEMDHHYREHNIRDGPKHDNILPLIKTTPGDYDTLQVSCIPCVPQRSLEKLFAIIPGMLQFKYAVDAFKGVCMAEVKYETKVAAGHALATLNNYEFPSGQMISVKPENTLNNVADSLSKIVNSFKTSLDSNSDLMQLADAIAQASSLLKAATSGVDIKSGGRSYDDFCSVPLPPIQPRASSDAKVAQRCFLVFKPHPPPLPVLHDVFSRFGDLIDVNVIPNKTYGFAKYASSKSAQDAINTLHEATIHGVKLKVLEAEEMRRENRAIKMDEDSDHNDERKRARLDDK